MPENGDKFISTDNNFWRYDAPNQDFIRYKNEHNQVDAARDTDMQRLSVRDALELVAWMETVSGELLGSFKVPPGYMLVPNSVETPPPVVVIDPAGIADENYSLSIEEVKPLMAADDDGMKPAPGEPGSIENPLPPEALQADIIHLAGFSGVAVTKEESEAGNKPPVFAAVSGANMGATIIKGD